MEKWIHRMLWWSVGTAVVAAYHEWGYALLIALGGAAFLVWMWRAYWDRASVMARQAIIMNWIYSGTLKNSTGTHDLCVRRGGIEARILHDGGVAITDVATTRHFIDFIEVERWLATEAISKPLAPHPPTPPKEPNQTQPKQLPPEMLRRVLNDMPEVPRAIAACESIAERLYAFVVSNGLYHKQGVAGWMMHPGLSSGLVAHALVVLAVEQSGTTINPLVWATYCKILTDRLARLLAAVCPELPMKESAKTADPALLELTKGEMKTYEDLARFSLREDPGCSPLLEHVVATFGGRTGEEDDDRFRAIFADLYSEAETRVLPALTARAIRSIDAD